jgi:hypothetical protein
LGIVLIYLAILQQPIIGSSREVVFARADSRAASRLRSSASLQT